MITVRTIIALCYLSMSVVFGWAVLIMCFNALWHHRRPQTPLKWLIPLLVGSGMFFIGLGLQYFRSAFNLDSNLDRWIDGRHYVPTSPSWYLILQVVGAPLALFAAVGMIKSYRRALDLQREYRMGRRQVDKSRSESKEQQEHE